MSSNERTNGRTIEGTDKLKKVSIAVETLQKGKSDRVDNIPAELLQVDEKITTDVLTHVCNKIRVWLFKANDVVCYIF